MSGCIWGTLHLAVAVYPPGGRAPCVEESDRGDIHWKKRCRDKTGSGTGR